jgi:hypothetical protein
MVKSCAITFVLAYLTVYGASSPASAASQASSKTAADRYQVWRAEAVRVLAARPDANSLATAAALRFSASSAGVPASAALAALEFSAQAGEMAPQNTAIGWLHLQLCAVTPGCDTRDLATVLRWVDPENSAAWIHKLNGAQKDKDTVEVDRVLADMARGTRFDLYYNQIVVQMFDALSAVRQELPGGYAASDAARLGLLEALVSAEIVPSFSPLTSACRESPAGIERREDCLKIAKIMQKGDTVAVQMMGFGLERRLLSPDSKEARVISERRQLLEWRVTAAGKLDVPLLPWTRNARTRRRLAQMRLRPREEDVCIALLQEHNMALEPSAENHR